MSTKHVVLSTQLPSELYDNASINNMPNRNINYMQLCRKLNIIFIVKNKEKLLCHASNLGLKYNSTSQYTNAE